jgi:WD40 repeat protein
LGYGEGEEVMTLAGHRDAVNCCAYSWDGQHIISGSGDDTIRLWDAQTGRELSCFLVGRPVAKLAVAPSGRRIAHGDIWGGLYILHFLTNG